MKHNLSNADKNKRATKKDSASISELLYHILPPAVLALFASIFYYASLTYEFQFDDIANIERHFAIRHNTFKSLFFSGTRWISYWLNTLYYHIGHFNPFWYRVGSVAIHVTNASLIFFILKFILKKTASKIFFKTYADIIAWTASLLFLLHPVQTQTVTYVIQGQLEGLAMMCILSMILCNLYRSYSQKLLNRTLLTLLLYVLAAFSCGTKEIAIISPALLLLVDWFFIAQGEFASLKKRLPLYIGLFILIAGIYTYHLKPSFFVDILGLKSVAKNNIGNIITQDPKASISVWDFFISQFKVVLHYIWIFIWPFGISVEYDWLLSTSFFALDCIVPFLILMVLALATLKLLWEDKKNPIGFAALWFFICIAPRSSIIPSPELLVDYKTYMASFGIFLLLSCALIWTLNYSIKQLSYVPKALDILHHKYSQVILTCMLALPLGLATAQRNTVWSSGTEFWGNILKNAPGKARAYNNYGVELSQANKFEESIEYFKKAIDMDKQYHDPCNNLAVAYSQLGRTDEAIAALQEGLRINPYYPEAYNNIASFYLQKKDYELAERTLMTALKLRPYYGKAYYNLGRVYLEQNKTEIAWGFFKKACTEADLDTEVGFNMYGRVSIALNKNEDAIIAFERMVKLNPNNNETWFNLGNSYFAQNNFDKAINCYQNQVKLKPDDYRGWYNIGETCCKQERFSEALAAYAKLEKVKPDFPYAYLRSAQCYDNTGQRPKAIEQLQHITHLGDKAPQDLRTMAQTLIAQLSGNKLPSNASGNNIA